MRNQTGFALIELMVVVAIIAILAMIALPAYQNYVARTQVAEGFSLATGAREAIANYYGEHGQFPPDNEAAGMPAAGVISGRYVAAVAVNEDGEIEVTFSDAANAKIAGRSLVLHAADNGGSLSWQCDGLEATLLPASCR